MDYNMPKRKSILITTILITLVAAIGLGTFVTNSNNQENTYYEPQATSSDRAGPFTESYSQNNAQDALERKKATRINIEIRVEDISQVQSQIKDLVEKEGGFITSDSLQNDEIRSGRLEFKIPEQNSSKIIPEIEKLGSVDYKRTAVDDVTDQYDQVQTELKNRRQELTRLEELLNQTENVSELIKVQERMSEVRSRIDYLEQRKTSLDNRIEYTEVSVSLSEPTPFNTGFEPRQTLTNAYKGFFNSINIIIIGLAYLMPLIVLGAATLGIRKFASRRSK